MYVVWRVAGACALLAPERFVFYSYSLFIGRCPVNMNFSTPKMGASEHKMAFIENGFNDFD
jgi:hypothetical protein